MFGFSGKLSPQDGILGGDTNGARIQVALPHHRAAHYNQRGSTEAELIGTQ